eukprot:5232519-Prymnesium_polylepis.1
MLLWALERDGSSFQKLPVHHKSPHPLLTLPITSAALRPDRLARAGWSGAAAFSATFWHVM